MSGGGNPTAAQASSSFLRSTVILPVIVSIMAVVVLAITVLLAAVVCAVSILIVSRLDGMVVPVPGNVTLIIGSSFVAALIRLAAVVYAVVVLIVTGFHVMLVVPVAPDVTCVPARIPSTIVAPISVGGLFTSAAFVLRWSLGRSVVIGRMVGVIARVPGTAACVIRRVVRRLIRWIRDVGRVTSIRRPLVRFGTRGNLLMILDASRPLISSRRVSQRSRDQFFGFCRL